MYCKFLYWILKFCIIFFCDVYVEFENDMGNVVVKFYFVWIINGNFCEIDFWLFFYIYYYEFIVICLY